MWARSRLSAWCFLALCLCACRAADAPAAPPPSGGGTWIVLFTYNRTITGQAAGNGVTVTEDNAEMFRGELNCAPRPGAAPGTEYVCRGTAEAAYASRGACVTGGKTNSFAEEAQPWKGGVEGQLTFDLQAAPTAAWTFTVEAPSMHIRQVEVEFSGKRNEGEMQFQVLPDLIATGALRPDGLSGTWEEQGENVDELIFGECFTGRHVEIERAQARVDVQKQ